MLCLCSACASKEACIYFCLQTVWYFNVELEVNKEGNIFIFSHCCIVSYYISINNTLGSVTFFWKSQEWRKFQVKAVYYNIKPFFFLPSKQCKDHCGGKKAICAEDDTDEIS